MNCNDYKDLMMGYLDNEITEDQKKEFEQHVQTCQTCKQELADFRKLISIADDIQLVEPEDKLLQQYWNNTYNRLERGIGWILFSIAAISLIIYGGFKAIEDIIIDPTLGIMLKIGLLALLAGFALLLVSVARERLFFWKNDRYKDVRR